MVYQADRQVTLLELLAEAGGIASDAGDTVIITRSVGAQYVDVSESLAIGPEQAITNGPATATSEPPSLDDPKLTAPPAAPPAAAPDGTAAATTGTTGTAAKAKASAPVIVGNTITINLNEIAEMGDTTNNIPLMAGDIVTVPHAGIVYVLGAVGKPGGYVLSNDRSEVSTLKILALAGGMTATAKSDHAVLIRKNDQGQQHEVEVDLKESIKAGNSGRATASQRHFVRSR